MTNTHRHITEAWQPKTFNNEAAKEKHNDRAKLCSECQFCQYTGPYIKTNGEAGLLFRCGVCRGGLHQKTRRSGESCPVGKW